MSAKFKDYMVWTLQWGWVLVTKESNEYVLVSKNGTVVCKNSLLDGIHQVLKSGMPANVNLFIRALSDSEIKEASRQVLHWRRHGTVHKDAQLLRDIARTMEWIGIPEWESMRMADQLLIEEAAIRYCGFQHGA